MKELLSKEELLSMATEFFLGPEPLLMGTPYWWEFFSDSPRNHGVYVRNMGSKYDAGPDRWAIKGSFGCLNKLGDWEYESMPSSRDDEFFQRCRYESVHEAIEYYRRWESAVLEYAVKKYLEAGIDLRTKEARAKYNHESIRAVRKERPVVVNYNEIPEELLKF